MFFIFFCFFVVFLSFKGTQANPKLLDHAPSNYR